MAQGNSSNANRYKGEDIDTDGDGSVNDAQTLQGNTAADLKTDLTSIYEFQNDVAATQERHDLELSINSWNYDDGFIDIFWDESKIASKSGITVTTGSDGKLKVSPNYETINILSAENDLGGVSYDASAVIEVKSELTEITAVLDSFTAGVSEIFVKEDDTGNEVWSQSVSASGGDTVTYDYNFTIGENYRIGARGSNWDIGVRSDTIDYSNGGFDVTARVLAGSRSTENTPLFSELTGKGNKTGSITHIRKQVGFTPSKLVANPDYDASGTGESVEMVVSDNSGNSVTLTEQDFGSEFSVSFNDGNIQVEPNLYGDGSSSPDWNKTKLLGVQ